MASPLSSVLFLPLPYLALMAPKSDQLYIQSFFGIQGQGRQVVELVKAKRGRPPKPRPAAQPAQEGLATAQQEGGQKGGAGGASSSSAGGATSS